jgi:uncharacterized phiE125 gp8 family phage protein
VIKDLQLTPTGSSSEPVTVADLKAYLQLEGTAFDSVLNAMITSSRAMIENRIGVSLIEKDAIAIMVLGCTKSEQIPIYPITDITSVEWSGDNGETYETLTEFDDYVIIGNDRKEIESLQGQGLTRITYELGAGNYADLIQAVTIQAGYMWTHRDAANVKGIAPIVEQIIQPYILSY